MNVELGSLPPPRALPVIVLADCSGSMAEDGKIETLNRALLSMANTLAQTDDLDTSILLAVVGFGGSGAFVQHALTPVAEFILQPLGAEGASPAGAAVDLALQMVTEDESVPTNSHPPVLILVSDGHPTDDFVGATARLMRTEFRDGLRLALAIGADAHREHLANFATHGADGVLMASDLADIDRFFRYAAVAVTSRLPSRSSSVLSRSPGPEHRT